MSKKYEQEIEDILKKSNLSPIQKTNKIGPINKTISYIIRFTKKDLSKLILIILSISILMTFTPLWLTISFTIILISLLFISKKKFYKTNHSQKKIWRGQVIEEEKEIPWWKNFFNP